MRYAYCTLQTYPQQQPLQIRAFREAEQHQIARCIERFSGVIMSRMAPTIFRAHGFRFFFFSREEPRLHVHVSHAEGEAKFWLEPQIALAQNIGLSGKALRQAQALIEEYEHDIRTAWQQHFGS